MMTKEETVADIAALVASKIEDVAAEDYVAWCRAVVDGVPATSARIDTESSMVERYWRRLTDVNRLLVKVEAFKDACRRSHARATAQKDK